MSYTWVHCKLTRMPCRMPVSSTTSRRAALSANSPHSRLPVTDCQKPGGRRRSNSRNSPPSVWITIKTDSGRRRDGTVTGILDAQGLSTISRSVDLRRDAHANMQFLELRLADLRRRIHQEIRRRLRLREGNDIADAVRAGHQHRQPIESEGNAAMRRRPELERIQQESELVARLLRRNTQQIEHHRLKVLRMNTHRAAADFRPVAHHVVGL